MYVGFFAYFDKTIKNMWPFPKVRMATSCIPTFKSVNSYDVFRCGMY